MNFQGLADWRAAFEKWTADELYAFLHFAPETLTEVRRIQCAIVREILQERRADRVRVASGDAAIDLLME